MKDKSSTIANALRYAAIDELLKLSEIDFQSKVIEPLLRHLGFTDVRDVSGPNDKGKDLVALRKEPFSKTKLYAIQVKTDFKFTGKHNKSPGLTNLITQLRQMFGERVIHPTLREPMRPDRGMFITPHPLNRSAMESAIDALIDLERHEITIVDGVRLVDELLEHLPDVLKAISSEMQYRLNLFDNVNEIRESSALGLNTNLLLDEIFVSIDCSTDQNTVLKLGGLPCPDVPPMFLRLPTHTINDLVVTCKNCISVSPIILDELPSKNSPAFRVEQATLDAEILDCEYKLANISRWSSDFSKVREQLRVRHALLKNVKFVEVNLSGPVKALHEKFNVCWNSWQRMLAEGASYSKCQELLNEATWCAKRIGVFCSCEPLKEYWKHLWSGLDADSAIEMEAYQLFRIKKSIFLLGGPGAGKTTILRRIAQYLARSATDGLPVFVSLNRVDSPSEIALLNECVASLQLQGYNLSPRSFRRLLASGGCRLLLDGLDETGRNVAKFRSLIENLDRKFPKACMIVCCRDTFLISGWRGVMTVNLKPFNDDQLKRFIDRWFTAEPSSAKYLHASLADNESMIEIARIPLNAALLCSIVRTNRDLPTNEVEMYDERLNLLLAKWEQAKGIPAMPTKVRRTFLHFLMNLAVQLHEDELRAIKNDQARRYADAFVTQSYHKSGAELIEDCIRRGLLFMESDGGVSFGHLAYQEFLVAKWLCHHQPFDKILKMLKHEWSFNALRFYAILKGDLWPLIQEGMIRGLDVKQLNRLSELADLAPLTQASKRAKEFLVKAVAQRRSSRGDQADSR